MAAAKVAVAKSESRVVMTFMLSLDAVRLWLGYSRLMEMACLRDKVIYVYIHLNSQRTDESNYSRKARFGRSDH